VNINISGGSKSLLESAKSDQARAQVKEATHNQTPGEPEQDGIVSVSEQSVLKAIEKANKVTLNHNTRAEFSVHEATKDIMVKIVDSDTGEVIREFPPKKILDLLAKLWDLAGIVVDERR